MKIVLQVLLMLCILVAGSAGSASQHEIHALQKDMAVLQAQQQQAFEKAALAQKLELKTALDETEQKLDRLSTRLDELDKRISDLSMYTAWFGTLLTIAALAIGFLTYRSGAKRAEETARAWMDDKGASEIRRIIEPLLDSQKKLLEARFESEIAELRRAADLRANAAIDEAKKQWQPSTQGGPGMTMATTVQQQPSAASTPALPATPAASNYDAARTEAVNLFAAGRFDAAFEAVSQSLALARNSLQRIQAQRSRGAILYHLGRMPEALADYEQVAVPFPPDADETMSLEIAKSHLGKALTLYQLNRKPEADAVIEALDRHLADTRSESLALVAAEALNALAYHQREAGQFREAIATVRRMQERFGAGRFAADVELKRLLGSAELTLALSLGEVEGPESERQAYMQLRQRFQNETDGDIKATVAYALYNTGLVYEKLNQKEAAREVYLQIEREYQGESLPPLVTTVRDARQRLRALGPPPERPAAPASDR